MDLRRIILRVLLATLGLAAVSGVLAVLLASGSMLTRIMWTCLTAALACAMLLALTLMIDRRRTRSAALLGSSIVIAEFILINGFIWLPATFPGSPEEEFIISFFTLAMTGTVASFFMRLIGVERAYLAGIVGLAGTALATGIFAAAIWSPGDWYSNDEMWGTGWTIGSMAIPIALALIARVPGTAWWRLAGVAAGVVSIVMAMFLIWDRPNAIDEEWIAPPVSWCILAAYANLLLLAPLKPGQGWLRTATLICAGAFVLVFDILVIDVFGAEEIIGRLTAALAILTGCGSLAFIVLAAVNRRSATDDEIVDIRLRATCPRCTSTIELPAGASKCPTCGLKFKLQMQQPRCPQCEYLLYHLETDRCPECGTNVRGT